MKTFINTSLILLFALVLQACPSDKEEITVNQEFVLILNQVIKVKDGKENISVEYSKFIEDSRCPEGSNCVWAGRLLVEVKIDGIAHVLGLGDLRSDENNPIQSSLKIGRFSIQLLDFIEAGGDNLNSSIRVFVTE